MKALGVDPAEIDAVVISHEHMDHLGGIYAFTGRSIPAIYLPKEARIWEMTSAAIGKAAADRVYPPARNGRSHSSDPPGAAGIS